MEDSDYVRRRAEIAGLDLSSSDIEVIVEKWRSTPLCNVDDLLRGVRMVSRPTTYREVAYKPALVNRQAPQK